MFDQDKNAINMFYSNHPALNRIIPDEIRRGNPVLLAYEHFRIRQNEISPQLIPQLESYYDNLKEEVRAFSLVLELIEVGERIDFKILFRGPHFPGTNRTKEELYYSEGLVPALAKDRLFELFAALALRRPLLSTGFSAREGMLDVRVYRGIFPLWSSDHQSTAVLMVAAPVYAT